MLKSIRLFQKVPKSFRNHKIPMAASMRRSGLSVSSLAGVGMAAVMSLALLSLILLKLPVKSSKRRELSVKTQRLN